MTPPPMAVSRRSKTPSPPGAGTRSTRHSSSTPRWVFNKEQMFAATNVSVLVNQFSDNIYGISLDGSVAFGPTEVFNTRNGTTLTNLSFSTTVQTLSGDQTRLFRYNASTTSVVIYDMASIAPGKRAEPRAYAGRWLGRQPALNELVLD